MSKTSLTISIGTDHAGFPLKAPIIQFLRDRGHQVIDCGCDSTESCDYPDFIRPAAQAVAEGKADYGIVLGGSGNGEAIVANRVKGCRCGYTFDEQTAFLTRSHNDANCIAIGQRIVTLGMAKKIVETFLATPFEGGRHVPRIVAIDA